MLKNFKDSLLKLFWRYIVEPFIILPIFSVVTGIFVYFTDILKIGSPLSYLLLFFIMLNILLSLLKFKNLSLTREIFLSNRNKNLTKECYVKLEFNGAFELKDISNATLMSPYHYKGKDNIDIFRITIIFKEIIKNSFLNDNPTLDINPKINYRLIESNPTYITIDVFDIKPGAYRIDIR